MVFILVLTVPTFFLRRKIIQIFVCVEIVSFKTNKRNNDDIILLLYQCKYNILLLQLL